ncbi:MAG: c-type cytochrome [Planctomycetota bacterium]
MRKRPSAIYNDPGYFYSPRKLIRIFTVSVAALMIAMLWWLWVDFDRDWKDEQRAEAVWEARKLLLERLILRELTREDRAGLAERRKQALEKMAERRDEIAALDREIARAKGVLYAADLYYKDQKQYTIEAEYWIHEAESPEASRRWQERRLAEQDEEDRLRDAQQYAAASLKRLLAKRDSRQEELDTIATEARQNRKLKRINIAGGLIRKKKWFNPVREIPLLDFLAPPTKVEQIVLDDLVDNYEFATPKKVDRCGTCHLGAMRVGFEQAKWPVEGFRGNAAAFEGAVYRFVYDLLDSVTPKLAKDVAYAYEEELNRRVEIHHDALNLMFQGYDEESGEIPLHAEGPMKGEKVWRTYQTPRGDQTLGDLFVGLLEELEGQGHWRTHPHFDDMVGATSPHPYEQFGCSICHQGRGWSVDFGLAYHTPGRVRVDDWMTGERAAEDGYHAPPSALYGLDQAMDMGNVTELDQSGAPKPEAERTYKNHTGWVSDHDTGRDWEENRGWTKSKRHYWHWPQFPTMLVQSSCLKCHREGVYRTARPEYENVRIGKPDPDVPDTFDWEDHALAENEGQADAPNRLFIPEDPEPYRPRNLEQGLDDFLRFGCYGCHKLDPKAYPFMAHERPRMGPPLDEISAKTEKRWARKWIRNPKDFRPHTRMPRFWGLSNNSHDFRFRFADEGLKEVDGQAWAEAEIHAIVEWVWDESAGRARQYKPLDLTQADPRRGEQLLVGDAQASGQQGKGCIACHEIEITTDVLQYDRTKLADHTDPATRRRTGWKHRMSRRQGPDLAGLGSKVTAEWLYDWLRNPRGWWHSTNMPDLRLTHQEALDIVAHLQARTHTAFDALSDVPLHQPIVDVIAKELKVAERKESTRDALNTVKRWTPRQRTLYVGKKLFKHYGCFGCHEIAEYKNETPIGTELTQWGSKLIDRLEWNHAPIERTRFDFAYTKMINPRIYDRGMPRRDRPYERLRMPRFGFTPEEARNISTFLVGLVADPVPEPSLFKPDSHQEDILHGRRILRRYNCQGCHLVEGEGGDLWPAIADAKWRPPDLIGQGAKTQWQWLFQFMKQPDFVAVPGQPGTDRVRPWHSIRMPTFHLSDDEARAVVRYFAALSGVPADFETEPADSLVGPASRYAREKAVTLSDPDNRERKYQLRVRNRLEETRAMFQEYQCKSCHSTEAQIANQAPDFRHSRAGRLRPEWVELWLWGPLKLQPGTAMPMFFATEDGPVAQDAQFFDASPDEQIRALRDYVRHHYREEDR